MVDADPRGDVVDVRARSRRAASPGPVRPSARRKRDREVDPDDAARLADRVELLVGQVARRGAERVRVRVRRDERRLRDARRRPRSRPRSGARRRRGCPSRLQARTRLAAGRRSGPGPVSGEDGKRNGTPSAKAFGRDQTMPSERRPRSYQRSRSERSGASGSAPSRCMIAVTRPGSKSPTRRAIVTPRPSSAAASSSGDARAPRSGGIGASSGSAYGAAPAPRAAPRPGRRARRSRRRSRPRRAVARSMCRGSCPRQTPQRRGRCGRRGSRRASYGPPASLAAWPRARASRSRTTTITTTSTTHDEEEEPDISEWASSAQTRRPAPHVAPRAPVTLGGGPLLPDLRRGLDESGLRRRRIPRDD